MQEVSKELRETTFYWNDPNKKHWYIITFYYKNDHGDRGYTNTLVGYSDDKLTAARRKAARESVMKNKKYVEIMFFSSSYLGYMTEDEARDS